MIIYSILVYYFIGIDIIIAFITIILIQYFYYALNGYKNFLYVIIPYIIIMYFLIFKKKKIKNRKFNIEK